MEQPLVSIAISCYNHEKYIRRALESAINQTYENLEILVSDDGSTDRTREIICEVVKEHPERTIHTFLSETNTGFNIINEMCQAIRGKYHGSFDGDDMWGETVVETYVSYMEEHEECGASFCVPQLVKEADWTEPDFVEQAESQYEWFEVLFTKGNRICAPTMFMRTDVWKELGGRWNFQYRQLMDYEKWLHLLQKYPIHLFGKGEVPVYYRIHENNLSRPTSEVRQRNLIERVYLIWHIIEEMEMEFFLKTFGKKLIYPVGTERFCLNCEKLNVLASSLAVGMPMYSMIWFYFSHIGEEEFAQHIEKDYNFSNKRFWGFTGHVESTQNPQNSQELLEQCLDMIEKQQKVIVALQEQIQER